MNNIHFALPAILAVFVSGCSLVSQKNPHVYHLLGSKEESAQRQASVLAENIPLEQKRYYWKEIGVEKGKVYYLDVGRIYHQADQPTRMKSGDTHIHVKPYSWAHVKVQNQDGSYDIDNYRVACYENLFEKHTYSKYTADHQERKLAGGLAFFADTYNSAVYINDKNINKIDSRIAKEICLLALNDSFVYPKQD